MVFLMKGGKMPDNEGELKKFSKLVSDYRGIIAKDYNQRQGDDEDLATPKQKVIKAFKGTVELKVKMLKIVCKEFSAEARGEDKRWDSWIQSLKLSLLSELIEKL